MNNRRYFMRHLLKALHFLLVKIVDTLYEILKRAKGRAVDVCHGTSPSSPLYSRFMPKPQRRGSILKKRAETALGNLGTVPRSPAFSKPLLGIKARPPALSFSVSRRV